MMTSLDKITSQVTLYDFRLVGHEGQIDLFRELHTCVLFLDFGKV